MPLEKPDIDSPRTDSTAAGAVASAEKSPSSARPRRRRRLIFSAVVVLLPLTGWVGFRWVLPARGGSGPSEVKIVQTGGANATPVARAADEHPIEPALKIAREGLAHVRADVRDYTARLIKRERINGVLGDEETMLVKIRNGKNDGELSVPFSVYLNFQKPDARKGREVIYVEGQNDGCLVAHEGSGVLAGYRAALRPDHMLAMYGNRYPITHVGIENMVAKLIERGSRELDSPDCDVEFFDNVELNGRLCRKIEIRHAEKKPEHDFFLAQVFIDNEHFLPVRYAAYTWPETPGGEPVLEEEYTYLDLQLNVGLTDKDFDWRNPDYKYPSFSWP